MMFKVGDYVRIRDDLIVGEPYGVYPIFMTPEMKKCCGKTGTVIETNSAYNAVKVGDWWWSELMVRHATQEKPEGSLWGFVMSKLDEADEALQAVKNVLACHYEV